MITYHTPTTTNPQPHVELQDAVPKYSNNLIPEDPVDSVNNIFCSVALTYKQQGTLYTDVMGALPAVLLEGHTHFFVAYDYVTNYIFVEPISTVTDATIVDAYDKLFTELSDREFQAQIQCYRQSSNGPSQGTHGKSRL